MSEDLIRRSDAIKAIEPYLDYIEIIPLCGAKPYVRAAVCGIRSKIKFIPTIEPKRGEWIFKTVFPNDKSEFPMGHLVCSVCGSHHSNSTPCNYCDNCGADMRGEDDEASD